MDLQGKVAVITGGAGGIAHGIAAAQGQAYASGYLESTIS